ncbi:MAG: efflux RND transporter periplasmic adaptor subunit [Alphaproteobacteria bacterium]
MKNLKIIAFALIAAVPLSACNDAKDQQADPMAMMMANGIPVRVETPQSRTVTEWDEFTGRFQAAQRVEIRARVSGYLDNIQFTDGQIVQKDDALFVIDQRPFKIALDSAQARFEFANKEFKRARNLRASKAISEEDYDQRLQEMRIAKADLEDAKLNLEFTEVKAPFTGRISRNRVEVGSLISGGNDGATLLTTLVTTSPIEFYFEGSETDMLRYIRAREKGEASDDRSTPYPVFAKLQDEDKFLHEGQINFLDNELAPDTGTIQVRATFENKDGILEPGLFARLRIAMSKPIDAVLVPPHIIGTEQTRKYVYTLDTENKAVRSYITLGGLTEDGLRIVKSGIETDVRMIVGGLHMVQPGALIAPIDANAAKEMQETK